MTDILFLFNPKANEGLAKRQWEKARKKYPVLPKEPADITTANLKNLIKKESPKIIAIAGGDGSINAVCNTIAHIQNPPVLTILPFGFGNALSYCFGVETIEKAMDVLLHPDKKVTIDLMKTTIKEHEIGVFNISAGFDARIVFNKQYFRYIGIGAYILSGLQSLIFHPEKDITFTIDHTVTMNAKASSLVIANCPIIGQNYIVSPNAKFNDGFLDCTLFSTRYSYIRNLRLHGFKHPLYTELGKVRFKARHIRFEGEPFVQIDGDSMIKKEGISIEILPARITFLRNKEANINQTYLPFII